MPARSCGSTAGSMTAPSRMEQSVEAAGGPSQLVHLDFQPAYRQGGGWAWRATADGPPCRAGEPIPRFHLGVFAAERGAGLRLSERQRRPDLIAILPRMRRALIF